MSNSEILKTIQEYIGNEQDGYDFYQYCSSKTNDNNGKNMFQSLAKDELTHIAKLNSIYENLKNGQPWPTAEQLNEAVKRTYAVFPTDPKKMEALRSRASTDLDALKVGQEMEKDSISAYMAAAKRAENSDAKNLFEKLVEEERLHLTTLENTYDYLAKTGSWFQVTEGHIFEG